MSATEAPGAADSDISSREPHCLVEQRGHVLIVTLNRPEARNALSGEMMAIMNEAWDRVDNDPEIRVAILTGAGGAFCAGADLKAMNAAPPGDKFEQGERSDGNGNGGGWDLSRLPALLKGRRLTKPLIAAVEGAAIAGGTEILQGTDIRVAGESAKFGVSEAKWGLFPLGGSAVRLVRQIPYTIAADILLTGRHIKPPRPRRSGSSVTSSPTAPHSTRPSRSPRRSRTTARSPCRPSSGPSATRKVCTRRRRSGSTPSSRSRLQERRRKEGPRAFAEKRAPKFTGS